MAVALAVVIASACTTVGQRRSMDEEGRREIDRIAGITASIAAHPLPNAKVVDLIERQLATSPCIKDLSGWRRVYAYAMNDARSAVDGNVVVFVLRQAGVFNFHPGRVIERTEGSEIGGTIDDRSYSIVTGRYEVVDGRIVLDDCGLNAPVN
jgi:hypothetical protein